MEKKILVIDDDESILQAISLVLNLEGYTVHTTTKGEEVFDRVREFRPNLILLDVLMSGKDGRDICKQLKQKTETKSIPVIMISAHPSAHKSTIECGAEEFLAKPFETTDLILAIAKQFNK